jgi:hypothetical protein
VFNPIVERSEVIPGRRETTAAMSQTGYKIEAHEIFDLVSAHPGNDGFKQLGITQRAYTWVVITLKPDDLAAPFAEGRPVCPRRTDYVRKLNDAILESSWLADTDVIISSKPSAIVIADSTPLPWT